MKLKGQQELDQFTLTRSEKAKELGKTPNAIRMMMRPGKLSGEYRFDGSKYLFRAQSRPRDYQHSDHPQMTTLKKKKINRGNHFKADYPNEAFKLHNEMKMMNKIKSKFDTDTEIYGVPSLTAHSLLTEATHFKPIDENLLLG